MTNRYVKRCSAPQIIRQMHLKTTVRYHHPPVGMAGIKVITSVGRAVEKREPLCDVGGNVN